MKERALLPNQLIRRHGPFGAWRRGVTLRLLHKMSLKAIQSHCNLKPTTKGILPVMAWAPAQRRFS